MDDFIPSVSFNGSRGGYKYQLGNIGLGYYKDSYSNSGSGSGGVSSSSSSSSSSSIFNGDLQISHKRKYDHDHDTNVKDKSEGDDDSSSDDSNSSSSSSIKKKKHKEKKHKEKKHKEKKEKKEKKHKKDKKHKKEKKHRKEKDKATDLTAIDQNKYGKYGVISEQHYFQKQREFEVYMDEVKKMPGIFGQSKRDIMQMFKCYIEDYNTATMPHEKYYNIERYEMIEYQKQQSHQGDGRIKDTFNDEEERRMELKRQKEHADKQEFINLKKQMTNDRDRLEDMRRQSELIKELQLAYKQGNKEKVKSIESRLTPDVVSAVKHPWA